MASKTYKALVWLILEMIPKEFEHVEDPTFFCKQIVGVGGVFVFESGTRIFYPLHEVRKIEFKEESQQ